MGPEQAQQLALAGADAARDRDRERPPGHYWTESGSAESSGACSSSASTLSAPPSTGSSAGQIYESNGALLAGSAASAGAEVENLGIVPDDRQAHRQALESGLAAD
ncbi:MAG: molybdopterin-binding protein, partial [Gaiellaceae bacterium]